MLSMNPNLFRRLCALLSFAPLLVLAGCAGDDGVVSPEVNGTTASYVTFRVVVNRPVVTNAASRAVPDVDAALNWGDAYGSEYGVDFDNALIKQEFNVFITNSGGEAITKLTNLLCYETASADGEVTFNFSAEIPQNSIATLKALNDAKIHIAANCNPGDRLDGDLTFTSGGQPSGSFYSIPMWGVKSFDFTKLNPGHNDAGEIKLLRAMAKVEILISTDPFNHIQSLTSARVENVGTQGYLLPQDWQNANETTAVTFQQSLRPLTSNGTFDNLIASDNKIVFYLPETENNGGNAKITLGYTINDGGKNTSKSSEIKFSRYTDGQPSATDYHSIVRNHLYRFEVFYGGATADKFEIKYTVCPWKEYTVNPPTFY